MATGVKGALLSSLIPGSGQWSLGHRRRSLWFLLPVAAVGLGALVVASRGRAYLASLSVQPSWLWAFLATNLVVLVVRMVSVADAYRLGSKPRSRRAGHLTLAAALAFTVAPHAVMAAYNLVWIDTLNTVFEAEPASATTSPDPGVYAGPDTSVTTSEATTTEATTTEATTTTTTRPAGVPVDLPEATVPVYELLPLEGITEGRYLSVLLAGGDAGPERSGLRTDTMIVATLDLEEETASLFGISRELVHIPIPASYTRAFEQLEDELWDWQWKVWKNGVPKECKKRGELLPGPPEGCPQPLQRPPRCRCFPDRLNAIHTYTRHWTNTFPDAVDPGMEALRQSMELLLGIPIDYYMLVDMAGFVALVDALGGVDITVTESLHESFSPAAEGEESVQVDVEPGERHLNGHEALAYVRSRTGTSDADRIRRQRCMLRSVAAAVDPMTLLLQFTDIAAAVRDNTTTNIPLDYLPQLVRVAASLGLDDIATASLTGGAFTSGADFRGIPMPNLGAIRGRVQAVLEGVDPGDAAGEAGECG